MTVILSVADPSGNLALKLTTDVSASSEAFAIISIGAEASHPVPNVSLMTGPVKQSGKEVIVAEAEYATVCSSPGAPEVGPEVGDEVGDEVGPDVGANVGLEVGPEVGEVVGLDVGAEVGP